MDLIERQAAIEAIEELISARRKWLSDNARDEIKGLDAAMCEIQNLPTIDPVKHGRWIIRDNPGTGWYRVTCSECGEDVTSTIQLIGFFPNAEPLWDYCPWCGARMKGEEDERVDPCDGTTAGREERSAYLHE